MTLAQFTAAHAPTLQALLPPHLWPPPLHHTEQHGPLTKYVLGEARPGVWGMLHRLTAADEGPPHDHPVRFESTIIAGGYWERIWLPGGRTQDVRREPGQSHVIAAECIHRITSLPAGECWSLVFAGPVIRQWKHYPELL